MISMKAGEAGEISLLTFENGIKLVFQFLVGIVVLTIDSELR